MNYVARWDGGWHPMPDGNGFRGSYVNAGVVFDDGTGPALYLAGSFISGGATAAKSVIKFDGKAYSALGPGFHGGDVNSLAVFDDGGGPKLYAGGTFYQSAPTGLSWLAKWDGASWSTVGTGGPDGSIYAMLAIDTPASPPVLAVAGGFQTIGNGVIPSGRVAFWNGTAWSTPPTSPTLNPVRALAHRFTRLGPTLFAGGVPTFGGSASWVHHAAGWSSIPGAQFSTVSDFAIFDDGTGPAVYAGGSAHLSSPGNSLAKFTNSGWSTVPGAIPAITALTTYDDGTGSALYAGASFATGGGMAPSNVARWSGSSWSDLGAGVDGPIPFGTSGVGVGVLIPFDDGNVPALYAGGTFSFAGSNLSSLIARWAPPRPAISFSQPGPGALLVTSSGLLPGHTYHNVFSLEICGVIGSGPYLGLCASDPNTLLDQFYLPLGTLPFHFTQTAPVQTFGPYPVPAGVTFDALSFDVTGNALGCLSAVRRWTTQ